MTGVFPYPGDDPASLSSLASTLSVEASNVNTAMTELSQASSSMKANWESQAADAAGADLTRMNTALSTAKTDFKDASTAVTTYRSSLVSIRSQVDDLRRKYETQNQALQTEGTQLRQADRYGEANDMSATELQKYKNTLTTRETATKGKMDHLQTEYDALVKKANTATTTCKTALQKSITGQAYNGSNLTTVPLDQSLGVSNFGLLHNFQMTQLAKKYADELKNCNSGDGKEAALYHKIAAEIGPYVDDPAFATAFYGELGPQITQTMPRLLDACGSSTAGADLPVYSHLLGTAMSNDTLDPRVKEIEQAFLTKPEVAAVSWDRAMMCSSGNFPSAFLAHAARVNALDDFAKNGANGFGGFGYEGRPNDMTFAQQISLPSDVVAAWTSDLGHNPAAARDALATMGTAYNTLADVPSGELSNDYQTNVHKMLQYANSNSIANSDMTEATASAFEAASGADDEKDGAHSPAAIAFTRGMLNDFGANPGDASVHNMPTAAEHYSKIASSYIQEMAAGYDVDGNSVGDVNPNDQKDWFGPRPAFAIPPELQRTLMHTFAGDPTAMKSFDVTAGQASHDSMVAAAKADVPLIGTNSGPHHLNDMSEAWGTVAGAENQAAADVTGEQIESEKQSGEALKQIVSLGIDIFPAGHLAEAAGSAGFHLLAKAPDLLWDLSKHSANVTLDASGIYDASPGSEDELKAINDQANMTTMGADYESATILREAGWPGSDKMPAELLNPDGSMKDIAQVMSNDHLKQSFYEYMHDQPRDGGTAPSVYETTSNAAGRYDKGYLQGRGGVNPDGGG